MNEITPEQVREFLLTKYSDPIRGVGLNPAEVPDSFDFLLQGVIDSFGILEMISSIEEQFHIELDMATLDAEQITLLGPLVRYVVNYANTV
ncbi:MAG: acyl carrier protein [Gemmatimonadota bacterium]|nr:acyl carrier protein [Gemmatimonadota bacterium]